jgi:hypothetical protein
MTERVAAYRTSDGRLFSEKPHARLHQAEQDLRALLTLVLGDDGNIADAVLANRRSFTDVLVELHKAEAAVAELEAGNAAEPVAAAA